MLKKQAEAMKQSRSNTKPAYKNKTWKRDADKSTSTSKKELAAFVRKQTRKKLYAFNKKRKVIEEDDDDDEKSHASLNNIETEEEGEIDLSSFNYTFEKSLRSSCRPITMNSPCFKFKASTSSGFASSSASR